MYLMHVNTQFISKLEFIAFSGGNLYISVDSHYIFLVDGSDSEGTGVAWYNNTWGITKTII